LSRARHPGVPSLSCSIPLTPIPTVTMISMTGLMALVGSSLLLWLALAALAVTRKLRRDGRERRSAERRTRYQTFLSGHDHDAIAAINEKARSAEALIWSLVAGVLAPERIIQEHAAA
jgi:hypothetical protein